MDFWGADTDSLMLDISVVLDLESASSDAYSGPPCGDASQVCDGFLLAKVMVFILAQID